MIIDKELNLDIPLEYAKDGSLVQAHNIVLSKDGTTIQNEPAFYKIDIRGSSSAKIVGHVTLANRIVLFYDDNKIYTNTGDTEENFREVNTYWTWGGGTVFGTATFNVKNELIVAISEKTDASVDYKVINIDNPIVSNLGEDAYKINPRIPRFNITSHEIINGSSMYKGVYNFYIRYYITEDIKTNWFPIGIDVQLYDAPKTYNKIFDMNYVNTYDEGDSISESNVLNTYITDKYTTDEDVVYANIRLNIECYSGDSTYKDNFIKYEIAYICSYNAGTEARIVGNYQMSTTSIIVNNKGETINISELTQNTFGIKNINTLCAYNNRIYIGDYQEEERNKYLKNVDTSGIKVYGIIGSDTYEEKDYVPGEFAVYNFYLHYVLPDGSFTDGIHIGKGYDGIVNDKLKSVDEFNNTKEANELAIKANDNNLGMFSTAFQLNIIGIKFENIPVPVGSNYVGYFISYEELENEPVGKGFVIYPDSSIPDSYGLLNTKPSVASYDKYRFYYPEFNIVGGSINGNNIRNSGTTTITRLDTFCPVYTGVTKTDTLNLLSNVTDINILAPDAIGNYGKEGCLELNVSTSLNLVNLSQINLFTLYNDDNSKTYSNKSKKLKSLGYIEYIDSSGSNYIYGNRSNVIYNYQFSYSEVTILGYAKEGIIFSDTSARPKTADGDFYFTRDKSNAFYDFVAAIRYITCSKFNFKTKQFNKQPERIFYNYPIGTPVGSEVEVKDKQLVNTIIKPNYSADLYKLLPCYYDYYYKLNTNYDPDNELSDIYQFPKTIRRSDVMGTETMNVGWLNFSTENYKVITENKGKITNIVGVGTYLLVHTEHSLFAFDVNNVMQTNNKDVQLFTPDTFDVAYKEIFTSEKGFGGLQDNTSWSCSEYGYIFYDKQAKKLYRFDNGQIEDISIGINNFIRTEYSLANIGIDKKNNRVLIKFDYGESSKIISYIPATNKYLAIHDYNIYTDEQNRFPAANAFINTKENLYMIPNQRDSYNGLYTFIDDKRKYSGVSEYYNSYASSPVGDDGKNIDFKVELDDNGEPCSYIDVAFTGELYNKIKVLDFITYILDKEPDDNYERLDLMIYTNCCYSDYLNINEERKSVSDYKKPYFDFGRWNFNYFRNKVDKINTEYIINRTYAKLNPNINLVVQKGLDNALIIGKYAVVRLVFRNSQKQVNIKDIQAYFKQ